MSTATYALLIAPSRSLKCGQCADGRANARSGAAPVRRSAVPPVRDGVNGRRGRWSMSGISQPRGRRGGRPDAGSAKQSLTQKIQFSSRVSRIDAISETMQDMMRSRVSSHRPAPGLREMCGDRITTRRLPPGRETDIRLPDPGVSIRLPASMTSPLNGGSRVSPVSSGGSSRRHGSFSDCPVLDLHGLVSRCAAGSETRVAIRSGQIPSTTRSASWRISGSVSANGPPAPAEPAPARPSDPDRPVSDPSRRSARPVQRVASPC